MCVVLTYTLQVSRRVGGGGQWTFKGDWVGVYIVVLFRKRNSSWLFRRDLSRPMGGMPLAHRV